MLVHTFAVIGGLQNDEYVLDQDNEGDGPEDEGHGAKDVLRVRREGGEDRAACMHRASFKVQKTERGESATEVQERFVLHPAAFTHGQLMDKLYGTQVLYCTMYMVSWYGWNSLRQ